MTPYQDPIRSADRREGEALTISLSHSKSAGVRSVAGAARKSDESKRKTEYRVLVVNDMPDQLEVIEHPRRRNSREHVIARKDVLPQDQRLGEVVVQCLSSIREGHSVTEHQEDGR